MPPASTCLFCRIVDGEVNAATVFESDDVLGFLDHAPVFPGHVLLVPKVHHATLTDLPSALLTPLFEASQRVARAVAAVVEADGTWVSMNNVVSQSVPHLHVHVVPRRRKDGLRGFYWPRTKYASVDEMAEMAVRIKTALG